MKNFLIICALLAACLTSKVRATYLTSGEVLPEDPATWTSSTVAIVGKTTSGSLTVNGGHDIVSNYAFLGDESSSTGTVQVDGGGSIWNNSVDCYVGNSGSGTLKIMNGGAVSSGWSFLGMASAASGTATVDGSDSTWTTGANLTVGYNGQGAITLNDGTITVANNCYLGYSGTGSVTQNGGTFSVGGDCIFGNSALGNGTYNLHGGTLLVKSLAKHNGTGTFNFGGGTLLAAGAFATALPMTLTGDGGNAKVSTAGFAVTLSGVLSGASGLEKTGIGTLTLGAMETYAGDTVVSGGILEIAGGIAAGGTTHLDVQSGTAVLKTVNVNKPNLNISTAPAAIFEVASGIHAVGAISGRGITQVDSGATLSATTIVQKALVIGGGAATVPEPSTPLLLCLGVVALLVHALTKSQRFKFRFSSL